MKEKEFVTKCLSRKLQSVPNTKAAITHIIEDITSLLTVPGLINIDRKDIKQIAESSKSLLGLSVEAKGKARAKKVGQQLASLLPSDIKKHKSTRVIFNVIGSPDITLYEVNEIADHIYDAVDDEADIIFGATIDEGKKDYIKTTAVFGSN